MKSLQKTDKGWVITETKDATTTGPFETKAEAEAAFEAVVNPPPAKKTKKRLLRKSR